MKIWQRYIAIEVIKVFFLLLGSLYFLYSLIDYTLHIGQIVQKAHIPFLSLLKYYGILFSKRCGFLLPLAMLIATLKVLCSFNKSNELIARDESLHADFGVLLYSYIENKLSVDEINEMFTTAVDIEKEFICDSFSCDLIGMNANSMKTYIEFQADRLIQKMGYPKIYNVNCPFEFMDTISLDGKSNFFEQRVTDYNRPEQITDKELEILDDF